MSTEIAILAMRAAQLIWEDLAGRSGTGTDQYR